jgi:hypothetical protein
VDAGRAGGIASKSYSILKFLFSEESDMMKTKLAQAVAMALTGAALLAGGISAASAATTTMYNLSTGADGLTINNGSTPDPALGGVWNSSFTGATDGWANGANTGGGAGTAAAQTWAGTASSTSTAFGYTGAHLNWGFNIAGGAGGSGTISTYDSRTRYGVYADIDTAKGAWSATNTGATFGGWRHDLDVGLFRSDTSGVVTLSVDGVINTGGSSDYGFTIFQGMDAVTDYNHHAGWNANNNSTGITAVSSPYNGGGVSAGTPLSTTDIVAYSVGDIGGSGTSNLNTISFNATAGQIYTIFLGGYRNGAWGTTNDGYVLNISQAVAPVPIPAAAWLFGSALAGLGVIGRRKDKAAAA